MFLSNLGYFCHFVILTFKIAIIFISATSSRISASHKLLLSLYLKQVGMISLAHGKVIVCILGSDGLWSSQMGCGVLTRLNKMGVTSSIKCSFIDLMKLWVRSILFSFSSRSLKTREKCISFAQLGLLSLYIF